MKLNFNQEQSFTVPNKFYQLINAELARVLPPDRDFTAITLNFRDPGYSADFGGFHPVELRLEHHLKEWRFAYITDFSYQGLQFPELVKELDICFVTKQVFSLFGGKLNNRGSKELIALFINNFIELYRLGIYQVSINFD